MFSAEDRRNNFAVASAVGQAGPLASTAANNAAGHSLGGPSAQQDMLEHMQAQTVVLASHPLAKVPIPESRATMQPTKEAACAAHAGAGPTKPPVLGLAWRSAGNSNNTGAQQPGFSKAAAPVRRPSNLENHHPEELQLPQLPPQPQPQAWPASSAVRSSASTDGLAMPRGSMTAGTLPACAAANSGSALNDAKAAEAGLQWAQPEQSAGEHFEAHEWLLPSAAGPGFLGASDPAQLQHQAQEPQDLQQWQHSSAGHEEQQAHAQQTSHAGASPMATPSHAEHADSSSEQQQQLPQQQHPEAEMDCFEHPEWPITSQETQAQTRVTPANQLDTMQHEACSEPTQPPATRQAAEPAACAEDDMLAVSQQPDSPSPAEPAVLESPSSGPCAEPRSALSVRAMHDRVSMITEDYHLLSLCRSQSNYLLPILAPQPGSAACELVAAQQDHPGHAQGATDELTQYPSQASDAFYRPDSPANTDGGVRLTVSMGAAVPLVSPFSKSQRRVSFDLDAAYGPSSQQDGVTRRPPRGSGANPNSQAQPRPPALRRTSSGSTAAAPAVDDRELPQSGSMNLTRKTRRMSQPGGLRRAASTSSAILSHAKHTQQAAQVKKQTNLPMVVEQSRRNRRKGKPCRAPEAVAEDDCSHPHAKQSRPAQRAAPPAAAAFVRASSAPEMPMPRPCGAQPPKEPMARAPLVQTDSNVSLSSQSGSPRACSPEGQKQCSECGATKTPMWRKDGDELFCNACGLRRKRAPGGNHACRRGIKRKPSCELVETLERTSSSPLPRSANPTSRYGDAAGLPRKSPLGYSGRDQAAYPEDYSSDGLEGLSDDAEGSLYDDEWQPPSVGRARRAEQAPRRAVQTEQAMSAPLQYDHELQQEYDHPGRFGMPRSIPGQPRSHRPQLPSSRFSSAGWAA